MLLYANRGILRLMATRMGSIIFRGDMVASTMILVVATLCMQALIDFAPEYAPDLPSHYGMLAIGGLVSFAVVFRTTLAWQRYWEAVTALHMMYQKWLDAFAQAVAYVQVTVAVHSSGEKPESAAKVKRLHAFIDVIHHHFTVMSALAADRLTHGTIEGMSRRSWNRQILLSGEAVADSDIGLPSFQEEPALGKIQRSAQFRGHGPRVSNWKTNDWAGRLYIVHSMPSELECRMLAKVSSPIDVVQYWILLDFSEVSLDLELAAPIVSRMFQQLSDGMEGYEQALKLADVPFPLPFAQSLVVLLTVFAVFIPVYISAFTQSWTAGPIMAGLVFQGIWGFNELAKALENPYGADLNDICLEDFHIRFVHSCTDIQEAHTGRAAVVDAHTLGDGSLRLGAS